MIGPYEQINTHLEYFEATASISTRLWVIASLEHLRCRSVCEMSLLLLEHDLCHGSVRLFHLNGDLLANVLLVAVDTVNVFHFDVDVCFLHVAHLICGVVVTVCHEHVLAHLTVELKHSSVKRPVM